MKYKKSILIILAATIFSICSYNIFLKYLPSRHGATISQIQLKSCMRTIAQRYTNLYVSCEILTCKEKLMLGSQNISSRNDSILFDNMSKNERIVYFRGGEGLQKRLEPIQIYAIFESWLFIQDKKLPYSIIAISWPYTSGGMDNTNDQMTIITKKEFEEIYMDTNITGLNMEQAAKVLADKWIKETGYIKK